MNFPGFSDFSDGDFGQWLRSAGLAAPLPWKSRSFNSQMRTIPSLPPVLAHVKRSFPKQQFLRIKILNFQASERSQNIDRNGISWECNQWNLNVKKEFEKKKMFQKVQPVQPLRCATLGSPTWHVSRPATIEPRQSNASFPVQQPEIGTGS